MPLRLCPRFLSLRFEAAITSVRLELARFHAVEQKVGQDFFNDPVPQSRRLDRECDLDAAQEISRHPIGAGEKDFRRARIFKTINPAVFQETADDAHHPNILAQSRHFGAQATNAPHDQVDRYFSARRFVKLFDDLAIDQGIELRDDAGRLARSRMRDLTIESTFEFGSRVGFWRLMRLFAERQLPMTVFACALALERNPEAARAMDVSTEEAAAWSDAADAVHVPIDEELGVHQQCEGFTTLSEWDFSDDTEYPLLLHYPYVLLYPAQVIKQADLVLAMHWQGHAFTQEQKARNVAYYEPRTVRDSSLSACTQAVLCAGCSFACTLTSSSAGQADLVMS